jgi:hypothetical protein
LRERGADPVFGHAIEELGRLVQQAVVVLTWALILIALTLATWATITTGRAQQPGPAGATGADRAAIGPVAAAEAQPALSNQNVSGR